jgi:hypothetical protein
MDPADDLDALLRRLREDPDSLDKLRQLLMGEALDAMASSVGGGGGAPRRAPPRPRAPAPPPRRPGWASRSERYGPPRS